MHLCTECFHNAQLLFFLNNKYLYLPKYLIAISIIPMHFPLWGKKLENNCKDHSNEFFFYAGVAWRYREQQVDGRIPKPPESHIGRQCRHRGYSRPVYHNIISFILSEFGPINVRDFPRGLSHFEL